MSDAGPEARDHRQRVLRALENALFAALTIAASQPAHAEQAPELPIRGAFALAGSKGCEAFRREEEGEYVSFNRSGGTGENGDGGCDYEKIERISGSNRYRLSGTCARLDEQPKRASRTLVIVSESQIVYAGRRYHRCPGEQ